MNKSSTTVMIYLIKDNKYLMLHRTKKDIDINKDKYIGVGGHVEKDETIEEGLIREVKEETGYELLSFDYRGIVYFSYDGYQEDMHIFTSSSFIGQEIICNEGDLVWVNKEDILSLNLWEGDYYFLAYLLKDDFSFFKMKLEYEKGKLLKKTILK